jgi:hypothetical protein
MSELFINTVATSPHLQTYSHTIPDVSQGMFIVCSTFRRRKSGFFAMAFRGKK